MQLHFLHAAILASAAKRRDLQVPLAMVAPDPLLPIGSGPVQTFVAYRSR